MPKRKDGEIEEGNAINDEKKIKRKRLETFQIEGLEAHFQKNIYPSTQVKEELANDLDLNPSTVSKWFINRRVKMRSEGGGDMKDGKEQTYSKKQQNTEDSEMKPPKLPKEKREKVKKPKEDSSPPKSMKILLFGSKSGSKKEDESIPKSGNQEQMEIVSPIPSPKIQDDVESTQEVKKETFKKIDTPKKEPKKVERKKSKRLQVIKPKVTKEEEAFWEKWKATYPTQTQVNPDIKDFLDSDIEEHLSKDLIESLPLWKQLLLRSKKKFESRKPSIHLQQEILHSILRQRKEQGLPPFFAILSGPKIQSYRMEELRILLGRNTPTHKEADVHIGDNKKISHVHACIRYDSEKGYYCLENLSKNGLKFRKKNRWVEYSNYGDSVPLSNPAIFKIAGNVLYFQTFYITSDSSKD